MALNNYRQTGGGGFSMLRDAPVVYDRQQEIRQLLIDEVRAKGTLLPSDYFHSNWRIVPDCGDRPPSQTLRNERLEWFVYS